MSRTGWLFGILFLARLVRADAPPPAPEILVAEAASLYAAISYTPQEEDRAIRSLALALRQEPTSRRARELLAAIQKRREERRKQEERRGQQQLGERSDQRQVQPPGERDGREGREPQSTEELARRRPDEGRQAGDDRKGEMNRDEAERLLDALDEQERRPQPRPPTQGRGSQGPRW